MILLLNNSRVISPQMQDSYQDKKKYKNKQNNIPIVPGCLLQIQDIYSPYLRRNILTSVGIRKSFIIHCPKNLLNYSILKLKFCLSRTT